MASSLAEKNSPKPPVITDVLWTRRALPKEPLTPGVRLHLSPAVSICAAPKQPQVARRFEGGPPPALIVTSGEGARRLAATLPAAGTFAVLTFSREVERILSSDGRFRITLFAEADSGAALAAALVRALTPNAQPKPQPNSQPKPQPLVFAGAEVPAFDFAAALSAQGVACDHWPLYRTDAISQPSPALRELTAAKERRIAVALFSPSGVQGFARQWQTLFAKAPKLTSPSWQAAVIGPTTAAAAAEVFDRVHVADEPSVAAVIACLHQLAGSSPPVTM